VPLIRDEITIGRKDGNTIRLTERNVSRHHARMVKTGDGKNPTILVEDLDSYNGIRLNGERIAGQCTMRPTDLLQIGDYFLELQTEKQRKRAASIPASEPEAPAPVTDDALEEVNVGRLVVVSSNLAGQEYLLSRREVIIGRTADENDLVLNHRSISRHHAKFIFRDGAFTILDLGSANGVKVNGEAFGTTTLVSGDILELGHVKLRYCAPGDEYVFTQKDIEDVDVVGGPSVMQLVLIALILVSVAAGAFFLVNRLSVGDEVGTAQTGVNKTQPPKPVVPEPVPQAVHNIGELMAEGQGYLTDRRWHDAEAVFNRVLQADAQHVGAQAGRKTASDERRNQTAYDKLVSHVAEQRWDEALWSFEELSPTSVFYLEGQKAHAKAQRGKAQAMLARGKSFVASGNLDGANQVRGELAQKRYAQAEAEQLAAAIAAATPAPPVPTPPAPDATHTAAPDASPDKPDTAANDEPRRTGDRRRRNRRDARPPDVDKPNPDRRRRGRRKSYDALCSEGVQLVMTGNKAGAARLFKRAVKLDRTRPMAYNKLCALLKRNQPENALKFCRQWAKRETNPQKRAIAKRGVENLERLISEPAP
jgi:pSer/pThr/pTyr-binding forkhead associated (FHA) protein